MGPIRSVSEIPGMLEWDLDRLHTQKIKSFQQYLERTAEYHARMALHLVTKIDAATLLDYANAVDLMRIDTVGPQNVFLIRSGGCDTLRELSVLNPYNLHAKMYQANKSLKVFPPLLQVKYWIAQAKHLPKLITYR